MVFFLEVNCNVESETIYRTFWPVLNFEWIFLSPMHSSYHHALFICKILVVSYANLNVVTFHYTASKTITFVYIPTDFIRKVCRIWSCNTYGDGCRVFQYLIFHLKAQFFHWQQILLVVSLEVTGSCCLFLRKCLPDTQMWIIIVCSSFIQEKMVFHGKGTQSSALKQSYKCFPFR